MSLKLGIIVLDTLRYDTFLDEMPTVNDGAVHRYEAMYSPARWTSPAHASLFTGFFPSEVGVHAGAQHLTTEKPVLAEQLSERGFTTVALSNNVNIDSFFEFDRGFDRFVRGPGLEKRPEDNVAEFDWTELEKKIADGGIRRPLQAAYHIIRSDAHVLPTLKKGFEMFLANNEYTKDIEWAIPAFDDAVREPGDLFLFANFMPMHFPYDPPREYATHEPLLVNPMELTVRDQPVTDEEHRRQIENYRGAARYLDDALPRFIDDVDWDLLFVVSDHGELFGEHDIRGHQYGVYEELVHVPAVAYGNLVDEGATETPTSLVDLHRTLLAVAGCEVDEGHRGVNLLEEPPDEDRIVYAESEGCEWYSPDASGVEGRIPKSWNEPHYTIRKGEVALLVDKDGTRAIEPATGEPVPEARESLLAQARRIRDDRADYTGEQRDEAVPEEIESRLKHLGYK